MHPTQNRLVRPPNLNRPARGTRLFASDHVQSEKPLSRPRMLRIGGQPAQIRQRLAPFVYIWPNYDYLHMLADHYRSHYAIHRLPETISLGLYLTSL